MRVDRFPDPKGQTAMSEQPIELHPDIRALLDDVAGFRAALSSETAVATIDAGVAEWATTFEATLSVKPSAAQMGERRAALEAAYADALAQREADLAARVAAQRSELTAAAREAAAVPDAVTRAIRASRQAGMSGQEQVLHRMFEHMQEQALDAKLAGAEFGYLERLYAQAVEAQDWTQIRVLEAAAAVNWPMAKATPDGLDAKRRLEAAIEAQRQSRIPPEVRAGLAALEAWDTWQLTELRRLFRERRLRAIK